MNLTGAQRAAIVFAQLDDSRADALLNALSDSESVRLLAEVARLPVLGADDVSIVMSEFTTKALAYRQVRQGGTVVARRWLEDRLGSARASEVMTELEARGDTRPLDYLNHIDPAQVAGFLADEHPQVVALVLVSIESEHAARVVDRLENELAAEVVQRIATMGVVPPALVEEIAKRLDSRLSAVALGGGGDSSAGGVATAAAVLNNVDPVAEQELLSRIESCDPALAEEIRNEMFVFDDVVQLDDRSLQTLLRAVDLQSIALSVKGAAPEVVEKFTRNLSERGAADLEETLQSLGPQRLSAIMGAQTTVVKAARELADRGELVIGRDNDGIVL